MNELYEILKENTIDDCFSVEEQLWEYKSLLNLYEKIKNKDFFLLLIVSSCITCYKESKSGKEYWEKLSIEVSKINFNKVSDIYLFFIDFLPKIIEDNEKVLSRIQKIKYLKPFLDDLFFKQKYYYKNMGLLKEKLSLRILLLFNDHIALFTTRFYSFGSKIKFSQNISFPNSFPIVIDNTLKDIFNVYNKDKNKDIKEFYKDLSEKLTIPEYNLGILLKNKYKLD